MGNSMAVILKNVIKSGGMPLTQVSERIETMYLSGRINGEERTELTELMHEKADPANELGGWEELYEALARKYSELDARVKALEEGSAGGGNDTGSGYPAWEPWDGVREPYKHGDVVIHNGRIWQNMLESMGNVWEPGAPGVDERYWREVVNGAAETE